MEDEILALLDAINRCFCDGDCEKCNECIMSKGKKEVKKMRRRRLYIKCDIWEECKAKISDNDFEYYCCEANHETRYWEDCPYYHEQKKKTPREWAEDYGLIE